MGKTASKLRENIRHSATPQQAKSALNSGRSSTGQSVRIDLVSNHPEGIRLGQLMVIVAERYGRMAIFHNCSAAGMDLDALLHFLEARDKVRVSAGVVYPGGSPACGHE